jgi:hypothetical protein
MLWNSTLSRSVRAILDSRGDPATLVVNGFLILLAGLYLKWIGVCVYQIGRDVRMWLCR